MTNILEDNRMVSSIRIENIAELKDLEDEYLNLMMGYRAAIMEVETKLDVLNNEFVMTYHRNPIQTIKTRLKTVDSIIQKLHKKNVPVTIKNIEEYVSDIAGVRVICSFQEDIYTIADMLLHQDDVRILEIKDYLRNPKSSGYRSLHLIIETPIFLSVGKVYRTVEIQLRTIAMEFWASVEHQMKYKSTLLDEEVVEITNELKECADAIAEIDLKMQSIHNEIKKIHDDKRAETKAKEALLKEKVDERILRTY